jgi:cystathionine beta-lyase family protein involved in aluminum resistance
MKNSIKVETLIKNCQDELKEQFRILDETALRNQEKVLNAFQKNAVQARHMYGTTGYGYDDVGRDTLCKLYADIFKAESAIVSPLIVSGTHALTVMLFAVLRPGDKLLAISGKPYDTLTDVINGKNKGSLADFGIEYDYVDLIQKDDLTPCFDKKAIENHLINSKIKAVFLARSRGYAWRQAISVQQIADIAAFIKKISPNTLILVDNCYGEFVQELEPIETGADLIAGSLIKNIGGGLAPTGGYIAGKADLVEQAAYRLTAPSLGMEEGSYIYGYLPYYQGLFLAPNVVRNALKGALLFAKAYEKLGFSTIPCANLQPFDIVVSIKLDSAKQLIDFCGAIQSCSPIDSNVQPMPWDMPGYQHQIIMAAGAFVQGSSIELSADSPIKEPYIVYLQGGITYEHAVIALKRTLNNIL